ncbi:MAG: hypothetical protein ACR2PZ_27730 [Pseudomonadales bacterium]
MMKRAAQHLALFCALVGLAGNVQAAIIGTNVLLIEAIATFEARGGGQSTGQTAFFEQTTDASGTYDFDVSNTSDIGNPEVPPALWIGSSLQDSIITSASGAEISMMQVGSYGISAPREETKNSLVFDHRYSVTFEVRSEPIVVELFHSAIDHGAIGDSAAELFDTASGTKLSAATFGRHDDFDSGITSSSPIPITLAVGVYRLEIFNSDGIFDVGGDQTLPASLFAGLRFTGNQHAVPEPGGLAGLPIAIALLLPRFRRRLNPCER